VKHQCARREIKALGNGRRRYGEPKHPSCKELLQLAEKRTRERPVMHCDTNGERCDRNMIGSQPFLSNPLCPTKSCVSVDGIRADITSLDERQ